MPTLDPCHIIVQARTILLAGMTPRAVTPLLDEALAIGVQMGMDKRTAPCSLVTEARALVQAGSIPDAISALTEALATAMNMGMYHPERVEALELNLAALEQRVVRLERPRR